MSLPRPQVLALALVAPILGCAPGDGMRFEIINMERPPEGLGLPPPPDYGPCYWGEARGYNRTGDSRDRRGARDVQGSRALLRRGHEPRRRDRTWKLTDEHGEVVKRVQRLHGDGGLNDGGTFDSVR